MRYLLIFLFMLPFQVFAKAELKIGAKNFTEQFLLASITERYLKHKGFQATSTTGLGTLVMRQALEVNQLDIVWDYTGTGLIVYFHHNEKLTGLASYEKIRQLDEKKGLIWLKPSQLDNGYALTMQKSVAEQKGIKTIQDLAQYVNVKQSESENNKNLFAVDYEFASRPDGLKPLQESYDVKFKRTDVKQMDPGLVYTALQNGQVLVGLAFNSDGRIAGFDLVSLQDNLKYFPSYYATPVVRKEILTKNPELKNLLQDISDRLDTTKMMNLNKRVDIDHESIEKVASDFLKTEGLVP